MLAQDLVVYCNATQNQYYGDSGVPFNTALFAPGTPETAATTDNAINCCLRCAFSNTCNIWCALPLGTLLSSTEDLPAFLLLAALEWLSCQAVSGRHIVLCEIAWQLGAPQHYQRTRCWC